MGKKRYVLSDVESANEEKQNRVRLILTELFLPWESLEYFSASLQKRGSDGFLLL